MFEVITTSTLLKQALAHIQIQSRGKYQATKAAELAPGVVAVADNYDKGETDIYFDARLELIHRKVWLESNGSEPEYMNPVAGIKMLPGIGRFPPVKTMTDALDFARSQLALGAGHEWLEEPREIIFQTETLA